MARRSVGSRQCQTHEGHGYLMVNTLRLEEKL
jgi:hypothetical protein